MKNNTLKYLGLTLLAIFSFGCQDLERPEFSDFLFDGPVISLTTPSPSGATVIRSSEPLASITINFQVTDDLGIATIVVTLDGAEIANLSSFTDSKLVVIDDLIAEVATGIHTITITVTDINEVVTTQTTTFEKVDAPPYMPLFAGETFYMAFDGDFSEAISGNGAIEVGTPGFEEGVSGQSYKGAEDAYLSYPTAGLLTSEFSGSFWYKMDNPGQNRAGILTLSAPDPNATNPDRPGNRNFGIRLFREGGASQSLRLSVGNGTGNGTAITPGVLTNNSDWVHIAFSISQSRAVIYLDGVLAAETNITGLDWTGCDVMSIMSGAPRYLIFNHRSDFSGLDELRFFNKFLEPQDVTEIIAATSKIFNMPFDGSYIETISETDANVIGSPSFTTNAKVGSNAYTGADGAFLTFPTEGLLGNEISGTFWYKLNNPGTNRAGILTISPPDPNAANPDRPGNRNSGIRVFREGGANQSLRVNVGNGTGNGTAVTPSVFVNGADWVHVAFTISQSRVIIYVNGVLSAETTITGLDWTGCDSMSIMSGAPRYLIFNHLSDLSDMDELALYNRVLTQEEIMALMNVD